jgi:hypothetical protein
MDLYSEPNQHATCRQMLKLIKYMLRRLCNQPTNQLLCKTFTASDIGTHGGYSVPQSVTNYNNDQMCSY